MTPTLFIPVENQVRELDAKLLFASVAAERGFDCVLGSKQYLYFAIPRLPRGIFIAKSMRARSRLMFEINRLLGNEVIAWDEESLVRYDSPEYYAWRFSERTFGYLRHLFAWGEDDAALFRAYPGCRHTEVHVTGNPRADLLRADVREYFREQADRLNDRYGDFILVNTNFSFVNPFVKKLALVQGADGGGTRVSRTGSGMSDAFAAGMAAHQQAIFDHFRDLVARLGQWFPERQIVLRPHPSEDHDVWRAIVAGDPNVQVNHEGNVVPWLMASSVLVHNGCTTAVEAAVLERPAVTYQPVQSASYDYHLPNGLSHQATTPEAVRGHLDAIVNGRQGLVDEAVRERLFARHLAAVTGPLAADRIVDVLETAGYRDAPLPPPSPTSRVRGRLLAAGRTLVKRANRLRRDHWNSARYHAHRFPALSADEVAARIRRLGSQLGRFDAVRAEPVAEHVFRITAR